MSNIGVALTIMLVVFCCGTAFKLRSIVRECNLTIPDRKTITELVLCAWVFATGATLTIIIVLIELKFIVLGN